MKSTLRLTISLLLLTFICAPNLYAWSDTGHMAVAYIAYENLNPETRARVDALVRLNPRYKLWLKMVPSNVSKKIKNEMLFMIAATWADQIKGDGEHVADGAENGNRPPTDGTADRNIGYEDSAMHKYWHFIDHPFSTDGTTLMDPDTPNALTQITAFRAVLADPNATDKLKSYDLVWLMHLVGDVHQPLHCAARFTKAAKSGDAGGNLVRVCNPKTKSKPKPKCSALHSFWDGLLGSQREPPPRTVINKAKVLAAADETEAADLNADAWIDESFGFAKDNVYKSPIGPGKGPFTITAKYRKGATELAKERIALGGARLAKILNDELK